MSAGENILGTGLDATHHESGYITLAVRSLVTAVLGKVHAVYYIIRPVCLLSREKTVTHKTLAIEAFVSDATCHIRSERTGLEFAVSPKFGAAHVSIVIVSVLVALSKHLSGTFVKPIVQVVLYLSFGERIVTLRKVIDIHEVLSSEKVFHGLEILRAVKSSVEAAVKSEPAYRRPFSA